MTIHILPNISRRKGNQSMKFGQIVECNTRNIFSNIIHKMWWEISLKKQNLAYLGINSLKFYSLFLLYVQVRGSQITSTLRCRSLAFTSNNVCLKNKNRSGTNISASFPVWLLKKDQISLYFTLLLEILDRIYNVTLFPRLRCHKF